MYLSLATKMGIGSIGGVCFNRQNMMSLKTGVRCRYFVHLLHKTEDELTGCRIICVCSCMTPSARRLLCTACAWVCLNAVLVSPWTARPSLCCALSTLNAYKQQPDLVCAVFVLIELYFVHVSNTNPSFAGRWNGCHDIYTAWNAVQHRGWLHRLFTTPIALEWCTRFALCRFPG